MLRLLLFTTVLLFPVLSKAGDKDKESGKSLHVTMGTSGKISQISDVNSTESNSITITVEGINRLIFKRLDTSKIDRVRLLHDTLSIFRNIPFTSFDTSINAYDYSTYNGNLIRVVNNETGDKDFSGVTDTPSYRYISAIEEATDITISKASIQNRVYRQYYNTYPHTGSVINSINELIKLEERIWAFKDMTCEYFLLDECDDETYNVIHDEYINITTDISRIIGTQGTKPAHIYNWIHRWLAITESWTTNPLGITDIKDLSAFKDTTVLKDEISRLEKLMGNMQSYNKHYHYLKQKLTLQTAHFDKLRFYARSIETSDRIKAGFYEYENIAAINYKTGYDYSRIHDASKDFELINKGDAEKHEYNNDDKVGILAYNIPHDVKFNLEYISKGYVAEMQATRFLSTVSTSVSKDVEYFRKLFASDLETFVPRRRETRCEFFDSITGWFDIIDSIHRLIAPLTANLPPAASLSFASDKEGGYKIEMKIIESKDNDSSYRHTYTFEAGEPGDKKYKKKETTIEFHQKRRFQFVSGAHFFTGNAPLVEKNDGIYTLTSSNTIRYSVGIKAYFAKQTFSDINFKKTTLGAYLGKRLIGSSHLILSADVQKPLENLYFGYGVDIVPGLGINCGMHLYKYRKYQLHNGVEVGYSDAYKLRNGVYIAATMDGSVLSKIFLSIFKL